MNNEEDEFKRIEAEALRLNQSKQPSMTTLQQAAQRALECIERLNMRGWILADFEDEVYAAINALRTALEQQEPSQWRDMVVVSLVREGIDKHKARELADHFAAQ